MNRSRIGMLIALTLLTTGIVVVTIGIDSKKQVKNTDVELSEDASQFVTLTDAVPDAILEIRYFGTYNFVGTRIDGYLEPTALLTKVAADSLKAVSDDVMALGYRLKIYDAYRPQQAVDHFVRWAADVPDTLMKRYFYPDLDKSVLFEQEYIYERSGHSRGSTVDLTLFDMETEKVRSRESSRLLRRPRERRVYERQQQESRRPFHHSRAVPQPYDSTCGHAASRFPGAGQRVVALHAEG